MKSNEGKQKKHLYAPPGMSLWRERALFWVLLTVAILHSLEFFPTLQSHLQSLYERLEQYENWGMINQVTMTDLVVLLRGKFVLFGMPILLCLMAIGNRYRYYHQGSKSIYLMRRLPDRRQWHRSCLVQPTLRILLVIGIMAVLLLVFYAVYMNQVPEGCLLPNQWKKIWRWNL